MANPTSTTTPVEPKLGDGGGSSAWDAASQVVTTDLEKILNKIIRDAQLRYQKGEITDVEMADLIIDAQDRAATGTVDSTELWANYDFDVSSAIQYQKTRQTELDEQAAMQKNIAAVNELATRARAEADRSRAGSFAAGMEELMAVPEGTKELENEYQVMYPFLQGLASPAMRDYMKGKASDIMTEFESQMPGAREAWLQRLNAPNITTEQALATAQEALRRYEALMPDYEKAFGGGKEFAGQAGLKAQEQNKQMWALDALGGGNIQAVSPSIAETQAAVKGYVPGTEYNQLLYGVPSQIESTKQQIASLREQLGMGITGERPDAGEDPLKKWLRQYKWADRFYSDSPANRGFYTNRSRSVSQFRI